MSDSTSTSTSTSASTSTSTSTSNSNNGYYDNPYVPGFKATIRRHVPPARSDIRRRPYPEHTGKKTIPLEWVLTYPPTETPPPAEPCPHEMEIVGVVDDAHNVLKCCLNNDGNTYVCKIYDGLYQLKAVPSQALDICETSDIFYSREALAYDTLQKAGFEKEGSTPKYYGSWTFDIPLPDDHGLDAVNTSETMTGPQQNSQTIPRTRPIRMILIELIPGRSMHHLISTGYIQRLTAEQKLDLLAQIFETESKLEFHGVQHDDLAPRNVMVVQPNTGGLADKLRTVVIDFNSSRIIPTEENEDLPENPIDIFMGGLDEFDILLPRNYRIYKELYRGWLVKTWAEAKEFAASIDMGSFEYKFAPPEN